MRGSYWELYSSTLDTNQWQWQKITWRSFNVNEIQYCTPNGCSNHRSFQELFITYLSIGHTLSTSMAKPTINRCSTPTILAFRSIPGMSKSLWSWCNTSIDINLYQYHRPKNRQTLIERSFSLIEVFHWSFNNLTIFFIDGLRCLYLKSKVAFGTSPKRNIPRFLFPSSE